MWKTVTGFERYKISISGAVIDGTTGKQVSEYQNAQGFKTVVLHDGVKWRHKLLHRLVAEHFVPNPYSYTLVRARNGNITDVHASNLYWTGSKSKVPMDIIATDVYTQEVIVFDNLKEAAQYLLRTKRAIAAGKAVTFFTTVKNIKNGIRQPTLYPNMYGFSWTMKERR